MARVVRTHSARRDLKEIGRFIAQQSQSLNTALRFLDRIDEKCELYATQPEMGTPRPDLADNVRCFPVGDYVVFYEPLRNGIRVLLVVHGSRDIPNVFKARFGERGP